ncbi:MAG: rRNA maturation RNase YbeY [Coriobacteriaceae bacterium]|nr:rRNA maturation RNase YbeY [Coriobacteriaceae bacterium]
MEIAINYDYREADMRALLDVEALAELVISREGKPEDTEVSINFVTNEAIHELNRDFRDVDRPTDVLSFECDGYEGEDDLAPIEGMAFELGDIVVAPDIAEAQAPEYGLAFADEVSLLVTHGLLHLCGYDHMEDDEAEEMEARERELLTEFWGRPFARSAAERQDA